jgi:hypothetical protein
MNFILEILLGLTAGSFGFALGIGIKNFTIPRIKQHIFDLINAYVAGFLANLQNHPEQVDAIVAPFIESAMRQLQGGDEKTPHDKSFKILGFPVPQSLINRGIELIFGKLTKGKTSQSSNSLLQLPES